MSFILDPSKKAEEVVFRWDVLKTMFDFILYWYSAIAMFLEPCKS